jgi:hypothetical protein
LWERRANVRERERERREGKREMGCYGRRKKKGFYIYIPALQEPNFQINFQLQTTSTSSATLLESI